MNILLVNLTRFGDLLQSQAAISALAGAGNAQAAAINTLTGAENAQTTGQQAENKLALVCLNNFAFTSACLCGVSQTFPLPRSAFLSGLVKTSPDAENARWVSSLAELWHWRNSLWSQFKPDLVCNLTPTVPARLLAHYLAGGVPLTGFGLDAFGFAQEGSWAAFLRASTASRFASPFNVIDLFRAVAGKSTGRFQDALLAPRPWFGVSAARAGLASALGEAAGHDFAATHKGFVGFQLGASAQERRWPLEYFVRLGQELWRKLRVVPVLLGSKAESELAERYAQINNSASSRSDPHAASPFISLSGKTDPGELADTLKNCLLLVSNDTGTLHLAAGLSCPCLGIFLATAQPWDTGPGLEGSCSLEPDLDCHPCRFGSGCPHDFRCRETISPELVCALIEKFLTSGSWPAITGQARVWLTRRDENNFFYLTSLSGHEQAPRTLWFMRQRFFLRQFLDRNPAAEFVLDAAQDNSGEKFALPLAEKEKIAADLDLLEAQLGLVLELGKLLALNPAPRLRERFLSAVRRVGLLFENSAYFLALGFLWQVQVQEQGGELQQALRCITQYQSLIRSLKIIP
ncbi:MAG: glycosyltransferase family 9 protein [Deltaproteobacteria bacterium]|jgi:ADP-heptose:LPS heptosyltransferase|nr:glycosyltransferase family 9 protein [Deltaproteobacteria bacterium]